MVFNFSICVVWDTAEAVSNPALAVYIDLCHMSLFVFLDHLLGGFVKIWANKNFFWQLPNNNAIT